MKDNIKIEEKDILQTIQLCSDELDQLENKYVMNTMSVVSSFLSKDLKKYCMVSFIGILLILAVELCCEVSMIGLASIYFLVLGLYALYTQIKNRHYGMSELMSTVYLNEGKTFLIESVVISFVQFFSLLCFMMMEFIFHRESLSILLLQGVIPVYVSQIVVLAFMNKTKSAFSSIVQFILVYSIYQFIYMYTKISIPNIFVYLTTIILICLFIFEFITIYYLKSRKRGTVIWN